MNALDFIDKAGKWAVEDDNIRCVVLVGSYARGAARADSDVDLIVMADNPQVYIRDHTFAGRFGRIDKMETEDWGRVTSVRVFYADGLEVEFGFTDPSWCSAPLDAGTEKVLTDGYRVLSDKENYFANINIKPKQLSSASSETGSVKNRGGTGSKSLGSTVNKGKPVQTGHKPAAKVRADNLIAAGQPTVYKPAAYRSEAEIMELILGTARDDERIRAVVMNGSRTNPEAPKDRFQDYDIVYMVRNIKSFIQDHSWIDVFGERLILQMPEAMDLLPPCNDGSFNYQMLFTDGNRIDLTLIPVDKAAELLGKDSLTVNMMDKDSILPPVGVPNDSSYHIQPPTEKLYSDCCNEFWWVLQNVAKGVLRDEMPYAMRMFEYARDMLDQMACWYIGGSHDFKVSAGKYGKYFKKYLSERHYKMYTETYAEGKYGKLWKAIYKMCRLFRELAKAVADRSRFIYPEREDTGMTAYLEGMREHSQ